MGQKYTVLEGTIEEINPTLFSGRENEKCAGASFQKNKPDLEALESWVRGLSDKSKSGQFNIR